MLDALTSGRRLAKESARGRPRKPSKGSPGAPVAQPPVSQPLDGSMWVGLNAGGWGAGEAAAISPVVKTVRNESSPSEVAEFVRDGFHEIYLNSGNYNSGGVKTISPSGFASEAVREVKERPGIAAFEVLNEAYGDWYWGGSSESQENATAYANILKAVHEAFVKEFGSTRPLILASDTDAVGTSWNAEIVKAGALPYADGIALHPYSWPKNLPEGSRGEVTAAYATDKLPIYITELGWDDEPYENAPGVTETEQATNIYNFVNWARGTGYVADLDIFGWHNYDHEKEAWGIETETGRDKLSYTSLKEAAEGSACTVCS
jgi:Glycosyl hydrolase catalytic core